MPETILQPSTQDTAVAEYYKTTNYGNSPTMRVRGRPERNNRSYVQFDLSSLVDKTIISAVMHLWVEAVEDMGAPYPPSIEAVRCTSSWDESTLDWSPQPSISGTDLTSRAWHKTAGVWVEYDLDLDEFALMIATNYGMRVWISAGDVGANNYVEYATSENGTAEHRPKLIVDYVGIGNQVIMIM